jgi:hypothetical protein
MTFGAGFKYDIQKRPTLSDGDPVVRSRISLYSSSYSPLVGTEGEVIGVNRKPRSPGPFPSPVYLVKFDGMEPFWMYPDELSSPKDYSLRFPG